jgi:hypothetical protein
MTFAPHERIPKSAHVPLTGREGSMIFCNTSGFHRGGYITGDRPRVMAVYNYSSPASLARLRSGIEACGRAWHAAPLTLGGEIMSESSEGRSVRDADIPLERDVFMRTLIRELSGTLQDVVGLEEAAGFISVVGQNRGGRSTTLTAPGSTPTCSPGSRSPRSWWT